MERHFDDELDHLKEKMLGMADSAQRMTGLAVKALTDREPNLIAEVLTIEEQVNRWEVEIEDEVLRLLAVRQPAAKDLRLLTALLKINNDLERVADQACNIAETVAFILKEPPLKVPVNIPQMALTAQQMIRDSIKSFVNHDTVLAKGVCEKDDEVDNFNDQIFRVLLTYMMEDPKSITRAVDLILISRNLERIADHATNISEEVVFIEEGRNIKHHIRE